MKTENLIDLLAQDASMRFPLGRMLAVAMVVGALLSAAILVATIGIRPHMGEALQSIRVVFKVGVTLLLFVAAYRLVMNVGRPGTELRPYVIALLVPFGLIMAGVVVELVVLPADLWGQSLIGNYSNACLLYIPLLSLVPFLAFFRALRIGAPEKPGLAGAAVGLAAGGLGAAIYAWHCPDDSPLFLACWYMLAIAGVTLCGYLAGRRWLAW